MSERLAQFFSTNFMAPHGYCFLWLPEIVWVHVTANILIASAYFSIPLALWHFARKRPDMPFNKVFILFATFITLCGLTHVFGIAVLWWPAYGIEGLVMLATGIVSMAVAIFVWRIMPAALTLPSPSKLQAINQQLANTNAEIEAKVRERTAELERANTELTQARQRADEASAAKSSFLANMSHEIRTPMNAVVGIADLLARSNPLTAQQQQFVNTLQMSAETLLDLLNDLLDIEKIEAQVIELENIPFDISKVLEEVGHVMELRAGQKGLKFMLENHCGEQQKFLGDPYRLRQILMNLCSNAVKFTKEGSVRMIAHCRDSDDPDIKHVRIVVEDTGIGVPADKHKAIFEPFVQADSSTSRQFGGTGLGLSIVTQLLKLMQGSIQLESEPGKGSRFAISLPLPVASAVEKP